MAKKEQVLTDEMQLLADFEKMNESSLQDVTGVYHKFTKEGETINAIFKGTTKATIDGDAVECAVLTNAHGQRLLCGQTVLVKELKSVWDVKKEVGFPVRIVYTGKAVSGNNQYQTFKVLTA